MLSNSNPLLIFGASILQPLIDDSKTPINKLWTQNKEGEDKSNFSRWLVFCWIIIKLTPWAHSLHDFPNNVLQSCWNLEEWFFGFYFKTFLKIEVDPTMDQRDITIGNKNLEIIWQSLTWFTSSFYNSISKYSNWGI
jgi:hypothetical protein